MKITFYDQSGKKVQDTELNSKVFAVEPNKDLMHRLLILQRSNGRQNSASTLTKGEVRGGGRKPYKQKGTGRARQGSIRGPHYIGGGVAHGPTGIENYVKKMQKKARRLALFGFLSSKSINQDIFGLEGYKGLKTKDFVEMISVLPTENKKILFVVQTMDSDFSQSARNIPGIKVILTQYLNPVDLTTYKKLCFVGNSLEALDKIFLN